MEALKLISLLLDYPDDDLRGWFEEQAGEISSPELVTLIDAEGALSPAERDSVAAFLDWMRGKAMTDLQAEYVQTFDMTAEHSLHLTHHIFGDDRGRGPALIDLAEYYKSFGLQNLDGELPDYLPLMLEFAAQLSRDEARVFLADAHKVLGVLAANLEKAGSPYAPLVRVVQGQGQLTRLAA
jgi:nitrate reductase delta subunit